MNARAHTTTWRSNARQLESAKPAHVKGCVMSIQVHIRALRARCLAKQTRLGAVTGFVNFPGAKEVGTTPGQGIDKPSCHRDDGSDPHAARSLC